MSAGGASGTTARAPVQRQRPSTQSLGQLDPSQPDLRSLPCATLAHPDVKEDGRTRQTVAQRGSGGISATGVVSGVMEASCPSKGLTWLDVGCGTGDLMRPVRDGYAPAALTGIDVIDFLAEDMRESVDLRVGPAEELLAAASAADRVVLMEVIEHLESPWTILRAAARLVAPGGRIVVSTPNVAALRSRLSLLVRGDLSAFRADNLPHLTPALPHVTARILREEGLEVDPPRYAEVDVAPLTGGRPWPAVLVRHRPDLACVSVIIGASRPAARGS
jgi:2-polyprenyl-3-methyl-5-hydroxy-6-metoxy-1,4-benzoquinol methylase